MASGTCLDIIGLWSVGHPGTCYSDEFGFKVGLGGYKTVMIQVCLQSLLNHKKNPKIAISTHIVFIGTQIILQRLFTV